MGKGKGSLVVRQKSTLQRLEAAGEDKKPYDLILKSL